MQKVFVGQHHADAYFLNGLLQSNGIDSEVRGGALFTTVEAGSVIPAGAPEVWVLNASQLRQAAEIVDRYLKGGPPPGLSGPDWECPSCAEALEPQFTSCWKCGTERPSPELTV